MDTFISVCARFVRTIDLSSYTKAFSDGLMNLDFFYDIAYKEFPFDFDTALNELQGKEYYIVLTNSSDGSTEYHQPTRENWVDMTIAASTVPTLTKGKILLMIFIILMEEFQIQYRLNGQLIMELRISYW